MRAIVALVFVACSGQVAYAPTPLTQTAAGDVAVFGPGLLAVSADELRFELARPAYVTVLRVFDEWIELVYPFDPQRKAFTPPGPASHQLRFKTGTRRLALPVPQAGALVTEFTGSGMEGRIPSQGCPVQPRPTHLQPRPTDPQHPTPTAPPRVNPPSPPACVERVPLTTRVWKYRPAPELLGAHRVLVILADTRVDLAALGRAVDSLDADVTALPALSAGLLAAHRGPWAAYMARVN